jgi:hypothetical protein
MVEIELAARVADMAVAKFAVSVRIRRRRLITKISGLCATLSQSVAKLPHVGFQGPVLIISAS